MKIHGRTAVDFIATVFVWWKSAFANVPQASSSVFCPVRLKRWSKGASATVIS